jgi:hypothetical protein
MEGKSRVTRGILLTCALVVIASALALAGPHKKAPAPTAAASPQNPPVPFAAAPVKTDPPPIVQKPRPRVEVVFALDTTGSMGGLLAGAKQKIWAIASHIASGQPTPELKVGLVAYRDKGDAYVTRVYDLDADLDAVSERLRSFRADGGGDDPEHVSKALYDALHRVHWSQDAMKMIFLVGDAPPHTDYNDGYDYHAIAREAAGRGILIHAIRCGNDSETGRVWGEIAQLGHGTYASIDQTGGVVAVATPLDDRMAALGKKLADTAIVYGDASAHGRWAHKVAASVSAPAPVAADRSAFYGLTGAGGAGKLDADDILEGAATGTIDINKLDGARLPAAMKPMSAPERKAYIDRKAAERAAVEKELVETARRRDAILKDEAKKHKSGFDEEVGKAIDKQAAKYGIKY